MGRLALDEMFTPVIAQALRERGHDVVAIAERPELRAMSDGAVFSWAAVEGRWLLTENVKDFRPIMLAALQAGEISETGVLFTTSGSFPRSRSKPGRLIAALDRWLSNGPPAAPISEDWLVAEVVADG
jgi:Domain of unknown function (DUF5615)